jgi:hypothetical protein
VAQDDWRIRVEVEEEEGGLESLLGRLHVDLGSEARRLAEELEGHRLAVSRDGNELFVYAGSQAAAEQALAVIETELDEEGIAARASRIERWLDEEDRWDDEAPGPTVEEELIAEGYAPWEVRVELDSHREAEGLADRLEAEGYGVTRRYRYLLVGANSREEAQELARRVHGEAEPSSTLVWETIPQNPFALFGGLGGAGTPL